MKARAAVLAVGGRRAEIDMVQNFGALKSGRATIVAADIEAVVRAVPGIPVKVILETAALTDDEKRARVPTGAGGRRGVRQDLHRLSSGRRRHGRPTCG